MEKNLLVEYQREASSLIQATNRTFFKKRMLTNTIPVDAFDYYRQVYNPATKTSQRVLSRLAQFDLAQPIDWQHMDGFVGYFQYDSAGYFSSPIMPSSLSSNGLTKEDVEQAKQLIPAAELAAREKSVDSMRTLLSQSTVIQQMVQSGFSVTKQLLNVAFDVPDYLIFYRVKSAVDQPRLQGYVVKRKPYIAQVITEMLEQHRFDSSILIELNDVDHTNQSDYFLYHHLPDDKVAISQSIKTEDIDKDFQQLIIYQDRLLWPFGGYLVTVSVGSLPITPAMVYSGVFTFALIIALLLACYGFYRLGVKQLILGEQRLNFVSSVSHELKTPLTSIQMYAQMLKEGTVISGTHQQKYFEFIFGESERLTRLINNILQLSTLGNPQQNVQPKYTHVTVLQDIIRAKTSLITEKHNFQQNINIDLGNNEDVQVLIEQDAFAQIVINITDNAVKFFDQQHINDVSRQKIDFTFRQHPKQKSMIQLEIRDYGIGITEAQESKVFELFYRGGNELTRTTQGTGIGLTLVNELVLAQHGEIEIKRENPGLALLLSFQIKC